MPARIDLRPLRTSRSTAHGAQVVLPLDYMGRADVGSHNDANVVAQRKQELITELSDINAKLVALINKLKEN